MNCKLRSHGSQTGLYKKSKKVYNRTKKRRMGFEYGSWCRVIKGLPDEHQKEIYIIIRSNSTLAHSNFFYDKKAGCA